MAWKIEIDTHKDEVQRPDIMKHTDITLSRPDESTGLELTVECESSGPNRHLRPFSTFKPSWLDALRQQMQKWGESTDLVERIIAYGPADTGSPYVLAVEITGLPENPDVIETAIRDNPDLADVLNVFGPESMPNLTITDTDAKFDPYEWIIYPCAPGEEIIDVKEEEAWLIFDRKRMINARMAKELVYEVVERRNSSSPNLNAFDGFRSGGELTQEWGLFESQLSHCFVLGLPAYFSNDNGQVVRVFSPEPITPTMRESAWLVLQPKIKEDSPKCFDAVAHDAPSVQEGNMSFRMCFFRLESAEDPYVGLTRDDLIETHKQLLLKTEDAEEFARLYGLSREISGGKSTPQFVNSSIGQKGEGFLFYKSGEYWLVGSRENVSHIKAMKGLDYLHLLLKNPRQHISCQDLYQGFWQGPSNIVEKPSIYDDGLSYNFDVHDPILDDSKENKKFKTVLEKALKDREDERSFLDTDSSLPIDKREDKIEKLNREIDIIKVYLNQGNRNFPTSGPDKTKNDNLRTNVKKAIDAALKKLAEKNPEVAEFVNHHTITTGYSCCYKPKTSPKLPPWILSPPSK